MTNNKFSREYLFQHCNINRHCLCLHLNRSLFINSQNVSDLFALKVCDDEQCIQNCSNKKDTYGDVEMIVFLSKTNPVSESFPITINTSWIEEVELINNNE